MTIHDFYYIACEIAQNASERASDVVLVELFQPHHRSVILAAEPLAALPTLTPSSSAATRHRASKFASALAAPSVRSADVATIATGVSQARPRLRLGRVQACLTLHSTCAGFHDLCHSPATSRIQGRLVRATPRRSVRRHAWRWLWAKPAKPRCQ